ncbi:MAG TPA: hypothetical protein VE077_00180 [Candidatus Methylomirabilis sp.]|nr:hypothetical protein [Candidatus Methylomirabilis sp.]
MSTLRKVFVATALIFAVAIALLGYRLFHGRIAKPLGNSPPVSFPSAGLSLQEKEKFLDGNFTIIKDMYALPPSVLNVYTEKGGTRLLMANPGERFEATDVISDASVPRKRLIFAGVSDRKCFVHYEQGGFAHVYVLALFKVSSKEALEPIWRGYCGPAANIQDLRSLVRANQCSSSVPSRWD